jgi:hypothetical protein
MVESCSLTLTRFPILTRFESLTRFATLLPRDRTLVDSPGRLPRSQKWIGSSRSRRNLKTLKPARHRPAAISLRNQKGREVT